MRKILLAIVCVVGFAACDQMDLAGPPEKAKMKLLYASSDALKPYGFIIYQYDGSGNLIKESHLDYPSSVTQYFTYEYELGKLRFKHQHQKSGLTGVQYESDLPLLSTTEYQYQGDLLAIEKVVENGVMKNAKQYFYNDKKQLEKINLLNQNNEVIGFAAFEYSDGGMLLKETDFDGSYTLHRYENGLRQRSEMYQQDGTFDSFITYTYNNDRQLTEKKLNGMQWVQKNRYRDKILVEEIGYNPKVTDNEWQVCRYKY